MVVVVVDVAVAVVVDVAVDVVVAVVEGVVGAKLLSMGLLGEVLPSPQSRALAAAIAVEDLTL